MVRMHHSKEEKNDRHHNSNRIFYIAGNVNIDFDVYFANSLSTIVAQYRINL